MGIVVDRVEAGIEQQLAERPVVEAVAVAQQCPLARRRVLQELAELLGGLRPFLVHLVLELGDVREHAADRKLARPIVVAGGGSSAPARSGSSRNQRASASGPCGVPPHSSRLRRIARAARRRDCRPATAESRSFRHRDWRCRPCSRHRISASEHLVSERRETAVGDLADSGRTVAQAFGDFRVVAAEAVAQSQQRAAAVRGGGRWLPRGRAPGRRSPASGRCPRRAP